MANPSDGPASAVGTEILRRSYLQNYDGTSDHLLIDGAANYTYTVLSVIFTDVNDTDELISMWVEYDGGSTKIHLLNQQPLNAKTTFIFNDKFILSETDELIVSGNGSSAIDVWCTYIEQRWA